MVASAHQPGFRNRHALRRHDGLDIHARSAQQRQHRAPIRIIADDGDQGRRAAETGDVAGDIASASRRQFVAPVAKHRHRRLGGNTVDVTTDEDIQHCLAKNDNRRFWMIKQHGPPGCSSRSSIVT